MNRWSLVATQDPIKKDGRADLFLDPSCRANLLHREIGRTSTFIGYNPDCFLLGHYRITYAGPAAATQESIRRDAVAMQHENSTSSHFQLAN